MRRYVVEKTAKLKKRLLNNLRADELKKEEKKKR